MRTLHLQLERLRRHYELALPTNDEIALLDVSHTLRVWLELKSEIRALESADPSASQQFLTGTPTRNALRVPKGAPFLFSVLPEGALTRASDGTTLFRMPALDNCGPNLFHSSDVMLTANGLMCRRISAVYCPVNDKEREDLKQYQSKHLSFSNWLGAETVRLRFRRNGSELETVSISREILIKRVANVLDGSHASESENTSEKENRFDEPLRFLLQFSQSGLTVPYFLLMKIAQDILNNVPQLLAVYERRRAT